MKRAGFTLVELLVVIAIIGMLVGLLLPAVQQARSAARRMSCANNLRQLGLAMLNYESNNRGFPIGMYTFEGDDMVSRGEEHWRNDHCWYSQMGPYIEQTAWYQRIDFTKAMTHIVNEEARRFKIPTYACPEDIGLQENEWDSQRWARFRHNYVVNWGNTNYSQSEKNGVAFRGAPFQSRSKTILSVIKDGLSNTLLMSEVCVIPNNGTGWGGSISDASISLGCAFTGWNPPNSGLADETFLGAINNADYATMRIPSPVSVSTELQVIAARSHHIGGVNRVCCDGSVDFASNSLDAAVWRAMSTACGTSEELEELPVGNEPLFFDTTSH
ncbi:MAG: DUF1559 domain-containing protein [Planctomycetia bacterium]|nr:DUF1559 domain-containing protein [Planctomycetia bacterium]